MTKTPVWCIASFLVMSGIVGNFFENAVAAPSARKVTKAVASSGGTKSVFNTVRNTLAATVPKIPLSGNSSITFPATGIGKLYALQKSWSVVWKRNDDKFVCVAKGKVSVQPGICQYI
jgi:hypothetical protein